MGFIPGPQSHKHTSKMFRFIILFTMSSSHWCGLGKVSPMTDYDEYNYHNSYYPGYDPRDFSVVANDILVFSETGNFSDSFNLTSGVFTAPRDKKYLVTLTATMLYNTEMKHLQGFAQLFIMKNGKLTSL